MACSNCSIPSNDLSCLCPETMGTEISTSSLKNHSRDAGSGALGGPKQRSSKASSSRPSQAMEKLLGPVTWRSINKTMPVSTHPA